MTRERLPDRRTSWTQKVHIGDGNNGNVKQTFYVTFGEYPDGRLGEVFIEAHKEGTFTRGIISGAARLTSIALQCGAKVEDVVHSLRYLNFPPNGPVEGSPVVKQCTSVLDWIAQEIVAAYPGGKSNGTAAKSEKV